MKLEYFDLISPLPLDIVGVGRVKSPKLIEVADLSYYVYTQYVSCLRMKPDDYIDTFKKDEDLNLFTKFDLILYDSEFRKIINKALNFFFIEDFEWYEEYQSFLSTKQIEKNDGQIELIATGIINDNNYDEILEIILQRVHITVDKNDVDDVRNITGKNARRIYKMIHKGRKKLQKASSANSDLTLPNIISSVATKSESLNWTNIWDITIYQLFDSFERLQIIDQYGIASTQVSVWGDKEKKFKFGAWSSNIYNTENDAS